MTCWACELAQGKQSQHKTRWFYLTPRNGIVCEDLNAKGFSMRLLYVPPWHMPCGSELEMDRTEAKQLLTAITKRCLKDYHIVEFDLDKHFFKEHWHVQACLEKT